MSDNERMRSGDEQVLRVEQSGGVFNNEIVEPIANTLVGQKQQTRNGQKTITPPLIAVLIIVVPSFFDE